MSIYIKFDEWGRMGNRMFQYALGYILAKEKNTELYSPELPNFNIQNNLTCLPSNDVIRTSQYGNNYVNISELLQVNSDIIIDSFAQKATYYLQYRDQLRDIFNIKKGNEINQDSLIVHIRETDYTQINAFLGYSFYKQAIESQNYSKVILVTDNSYCDTVQQLLKDGCVLYTQGYVDKFSHNSDNRAMEDFKLLLYSSNILLSQSTFSWWAAFLGYHKKVIYPFTHTKGIWKILPQKDDIDLYFESTENKIYIND